MTNFIGKASLFLKRNSSTILTCIGAAGVIATAVTASIATPKAIKLLEEAKEEKGEDLTKIETLAVAAPSYIPAILIGASTIACIFGANILNKHQQAALASAYALLDSSYKEYRSKLKELYGEDADRAIRSAIAKDKLNQEKLPDVDDTKLFFDYFSGRYFESTSEKVEQAEYNLRMSLVAKDYAYLNDFYNELGLKPINYVGELGWSIGACSGHDWSSWIDFGHEEVTTDDGLECTIIYMHPDPIINFDEY